MTEKELARGIADGSIKYTLCEPQKVTKKDRIKLIRGGKYANTTFKGSKKDPRGRLPSSSVTVTYGD